MSLGCKGVGTRSEGFLDWIQANEQGPCYLANCSEEIVVAICLKLDLKSFLIFSQVCKGTYRITQSEFLWKHHIQILFEKNHLFPNVSFQTLEKESFQNQFKRIYLIVKDILKFQGLEIDRKIDAINKDKQTIEKKETELASYQADKLFSQEELEMLCKRRHGRPVINPLTNVQLELLHLKESVKAWAGASYQGTRESIDSNSQIGILIKKQKTLREALS